MHQKSVIPKQYENLYNSILNAVVRKSEAFKPMNKPAFAIVDESQKPKDIQYDCYFFCTFIAGMPKPSWEKFRAKRELIGITENAWSRAKKTGFTALNFAQNAFEYGAKYSNVNLKHYLAAYIKYSKGEGANLFGIKSFDDSVDLLLKECRLEGGAKLSICGESSDASDLDNNDQLIYKKLEGYFERPEILSKIIDYVSEPTQKRGHISIKGEAGTGKSSIMARVVSELMQSPNIDCFYHFISEGHTTGKTIGFIDNICRKLCQKYALVDLHGKIDEIISADSHLQQLFIEKLFNNISRSSLEGDAKKKLVIMIDALDEVSPDDPSSVGGSTNIFFIPENVPDNIFIITSSRNNKGQSYHCDALNIYLNKNDPIHTGDIKRYITHQIQNNQVIAQWIIDQSWDNTNKTREDQFFDLLCDKSGYLFIYLHFFFTELTLNPDSYDINNIPQGIKKYYERQLKRLLGKACDNLYQRKMIIAALCDLRPDVSLQRLLAFCGIDNDIYDRIISIWVELTLIEKIIEEDYIYIKIAHLSFFEFLSKLDDVKRLLSPEEPFQRLLQSTLQDITLNKALGRFAYRKVFPIKFKIETISLLFRSARKSSNFQTLIDIIPNREFCEECIALGLDSNLIVSFINTYEDLIFIKKSTEAAAFYDHFIDNIVLNSDPIIIKKDFENHIIGQFGRKAVLKYRKNKTTEGSLNRMKSIREKHLSKAYTDGHDEDDLNDFSTQELIDYTGSIRERYRDQDFLAAALRENKRILNRYCDLIENDPLITYTNIEQLEYEQGYIHFFCLLYTSPSPRDRTRSRMPSSA